MIRDARLYLLTDIDWKPLAHQIEQHVNYNLKDLIVIFNLSNDKTIRNYAILSMSEDTDKIIEKYGAKEAREKDFLRTTLHDNYSEPLFGDKTNLVFLNKV